MQHMITQTNSPLDRLLWNLSRTLVVLSENIVARAAANQLGFHAAQARHQEVVEACLADRDMLTEELVNTLFP